jgi:tetratricopeptide (TPR) repeat protein/DNA-binding CsgD family transcriptional regulator
MKKIITNGLFACACMMMITCGKNNTDKVLDKVLNRVENFVARQQSDSALILLDSIEHSFKTDEQWIRHNLFTLRAKDLNNEDISNDKNIKHVIDYMYNADNSEYRAFAEYCMGRVYHARENLERAMQFYLKAQTSAEDSDNHNIKGLIRFYIGKLFYEKSEFDDAVNNFKSALEYFDLYRDYKRAIPVNIMIGNVFLRDKKRKNNDSVFMYYDKSLRLAENHRDSVQQANVRQNLGVVCLIMGKPNKAIKQLYEALKLYPELSNKIYFNLGQAYEQKKMMDSAGYFAKLSLNLLLEKKNDSLLLSNNYKFLSRLEEREGNYSKALNYLHKHNECEKINRNKKKFNPYDEERKHMQKLLDNSQANVRKYKIIIWGLSVLSLAIFVYFFIESRKLFKIRLKSSKANANIKKLSDENEKFKKENAENEKKTNIIMENYQHIQTEIETLRQSLSGYKDELNRATAENKRLTDWILQVYFDISTLVYDMTGGKTTQKKMSLTIEKLNVIIFQKDRWSNVNYPFYTLFKNIMEQTSKYELSKLELQIVCLTYIGFNSIRIAFILEMNEHTIQQDKSKIKKKLKLDGNAKIENFILSIVNNMP